MWGLIWIQTVWHSDGIPERIFPNCWFWKKSRQQKTCKFICRVHIVSYHPVLLDSALRSRISLYTQDMICRLLLTFANRWHQDQARQNVGPDQGPNCLTLWCYSRKNFTKQLLLTADDKNACFICRVHIVSYPPVLLDSALRSRISLCTQDMVWTSRCSFIAYLRER